MQNILKYVNSKLEKITFSNKTKILIFTIFGGTVFIGFLMFISIFALKYDFETLFQNHTRPQVRLEELKDIYQVNIKETLNALKNHEISKKDAIEVITLAKQIIQRQWTSYKKSVDKKVGGLPEFATNWLNFFLLTKPLPERTDFQKTIAQNIEKKIHSITLKTDNLINLLHADKEIKSEIDNIILEANSINIYLSSLITNNLKRALIKKEANDKLFQTSTFMLLLLIGLAFSFIILISITIINNFKELHYSLEENVAKKTKELIELNESLERRIKKEVKESRKKDNIMFQQARLASMGEMLQNIAHQWRQPLSTLMMIVQSFQSKYMMGKLDEEFINSRVEDAITIGANMSDTLEDFRNFFNPNRTKQIFDIQRAIKKAVELSKYQLDKEGIEITLGKMTSIKIFGFKNELIHVILNLINNSKDILVLNKTQQEKKIYIALKQTEKEAIISVIDNGGGVKSDIMTKIFDPYFTTKHKSIGTGVGLYMSKQLVEEHMKGKIYCKNIKHKLKGDVFYECAMFNVEIPIKDNHEQKKF